MPTLKQLTCSIEWASSPDGALPEYGTVYGDGYVTTHIAVPLLPTPFGIRLCSNGYIAPGLAMFVYIDGVYQCNRNYSDLATPDVASTTKVTDIDICVRQREQRRGKGGTKVADGLFVGRSWAFEKVQVSTDDVAADAKVNRSTQYLGTIEVVVQRCYSSGPQPSACGTHEPTAAGAKKKGKQRARKADQTGPALDVEDFIGTLFDGISERKDTTVQRPPAFQQPTRVTYGYDGSADFNPTSARAGLRNAWNQPIGDDAQSHAEAIPGWDPVTSSRVAQSQQQPRSNVAAGAGGGVRPDELFDKLNGIGNSVNVQSSAQALQSPTSPVGKTWAKHKSYWTNWERDGITAESIDSSDDEYYFIDVNNERSKPLPQPMLSPAEVKNKHMTHYVQLQAAHLYTHRLHTPRYMDSHEDPYAVFVFYYRDQAIIERLLGQSVREESADAERSRLGTLSKEQLLDQLLKTKASLQANLMSDDLLSHFGGDANGKAFKPDDGGADWANDFNTDSDAMGHLADLPDAGNAAAADDPWANNVAGDTTKTGDVSW